MLTYHQFRKLKLLGSELVMYSKPIQQKVNKSTSQPNLYVPTANMTIAKKKSILSETVHKAPCLFSFSSPNKLFY